jgi:hexokinase
MAAWPPLGGTWLTPSHWPYRILQRGGGLAATIPAFTTSDPRADSWLCHRQAIAHDGGMELKVVAVQLESGTFIQRITIGERTMLVPPLRNRGQADRLSAELRALLQRLAEASP